MNKKLYFSIFSLLLVGLVLRIDFVRAQTEAEWPSVGIIPDSPFYFLERVFEGVGIFFTFGDVNKAEKYTKLATKRIAEAKALVDKGKSEMAVKVLIRYQDQLEKSLAKIEQAQIEGKNVAYVTEIVSKAIIKHLTVLEELLENVPEHVKSVIFQARETSKTGQIKAIEVLARENPERSVDLNIQVIQDRLEKMKKKVKENDEQGMERTMADFILFKILLEKIGKENKPVLASLILENITGQIEELDEIKNEAEKVFPQMAEKIKTIKINAIDGQIDLLRSFATVDPEKTAEIFSLAVEKRLNKAKQAVENEDLKEIKEALEEFEKYAVFGQEISKIAQTIGKDTTKVEQLVARATVHHLEVLNDVYKKVPEETKEAIQKAMIVSEIGRQQAVETLKEKGALGDIPELMPVPLEIGQKVIEERKIPKPEIEKFEREEFETERTEIERSEVKKPGIPTSAPAR